MENGSETACPLKKSRFGPKKGYLSRLSVDSDSSSSTIVDRYNQPRHQSVDGPVNGQDLSVKNHAEDSYYNSVKNQFADKNSSVRAVNLNQSTTSRSIDDRYSVGRENVTSRVHSFDNQNFARQNTASKNHTLSRNDQIAKKLSFLNQNQSMKNPNGDDQGKASLDMLAVPSHQRVDSLSSLSLPDDLRLSFSEIDEGSIQLDDLDLTYSPSAGGGAGNLAAVEQEKTGDQDGDLQRITAAISSTSEQKSPGKQITELSRLSEEFMTSQGQSSTKLQTDVKSENPSGDADITWDDIVTWGVNAHQVSSTVGHSNETLNKKRTVSHRRSSKNKHMENVLCQVCGDTAAGFYCGAFICEACKKFYMRAYKQDRLKYVCLRDKKCVITKESRVQCQYCRFQKCNSLNMYILKQGEGEMSKDMQMSEIPCRVCSAPSSGFHFGAITCEGCKGFFRRMAKEREPEKYQCNKKSSCEINMVTRNLCKACRYRACISAGMSIEGSRIGRQPNSVKHAISMELKQGKTDAGPDIKVKDEPMDTSPGITGDTNKSSDFSFWNQDSNSSMHETLNTRSSTSDSLVVSTPSTVDTQSNSSNFAWSSIDSDVNKTPQSSLTSTPSVPTSSSALSSFGNSAGQPTYQLSSRQPAIDTENRRPVVIQDVRRVTPPQPHVPYNGSQSRGPSSGSPASSVVFTPSPVTQFLSTTPKNENVQNPTSQEQESRNRKPGFRVPEPLSFPQTTSRQKGMPQPAQHSPTSTTSPTGGQTSPTQSQQVCIGNSNLTMKEFISKIIEAGKCLQLLNYRVFDTDVSPATSMNVDDIKALFTSKYMDPKSGNRITSKVDMSMFLTRESTWNYMMTNFHHNTYITIRFAKLVPGFKTLSLNDQVKLIQSSIYPIELLNMSKVFDPTTKKYNYFTYTKEEENIMMEQFPMLRVFQEHFLHIGEMVTSLQFTDEEFAILSALLLFPAEINGLENPKAVEQLQNQITSALQSYEESRFADGLTRFGILLVRVAELVQCLLQHNLAIGLLLTHNPTIKVPQLFHELIIESIKEGQKL